MLQHTLGKFGVHISMAPIVPILFNERIMMRITREDEFVSRVEGDWRNSSELVIAITRK
jgi:hypothetical protein